MASWSVDHCGKNQEADLGDLGLRYEIEGASNILGMQASRQVGEQRRRTDEQEKPGNR